MIKKIFSSILVFILVFGVTHFAISQAKDATPDDLYSQVELFSYALTTIQSEYVDEKKPQELIYGSLKGMLSSLDPHSQFLDPEEYKDLKTETKGQFGGLGIEISIRDGLLTIVSPIEDTPAWKAGVKAGDKIVKIEDELTRDITLGEAVKKLRGDPGTKINITVLREEELKLYDFEIIREIIVVQDVKDPQILEDNIGYVRLTEFREHSYTELKAALEQLIADGADSLILDLRNNPGGLLNVALDITEIFIPEGELMLTTKGRRASSTEETFAKEASLKILNWPIVILINEGSASGSEILAGALKDNNYAVILGTQSFGKGSVQSVIPLPDGSGLRLTTSKYYTPSGISIHGKGITPDIIVKRDYRPLTENEIEKEKKEIDKVFSEVAVQEAANPEDAKTGKEETTRRLLLLKDNQVQSALSAIKGIKIFKKLESSQDKKTQPAKKEIVVEPQKEL